MLKYPLSTLLYLAKINIKDTLQDVLRLHNNIDITLTATVKDKNGKVIKIHKQHSHSFVANFLAMLGSALNQQYNSNISNWTIYYYRGTNGLYNAFSAPSIQLDMFFNINDVANDSSYGIVVGTGTTPPTASDYALENQIANGTGSGQLNYGPHTFIPSPSGASQGNSATTPTAGLINVSGNVSSFEIQRTFTNNSGATITVSEVGIYTETYTYATTTVFVMLIHDLLSSAISIPNGSTLTITYTISTTT